MSKKIKVLYVDDEFINLQLFEINLEEKYNIILAEDGSDGLEALAKHPDIDVVVSDMKMPGMNGIEFITIAKEKYPNIFFYILTGYEITDEIQEALDSGLVLKYFRKPFNVEEIEYAIDNSIAEQLN